MKPLYTRPVTIQHAQMDIYIPKLCAHSKSVHTADKPVLVHQSKNIDGREAIYILCINDTAAGLEKWRLRFHPSCQSAVDISRSFIILRLILGNFPNPYSFLLQICLFFHFTRPHFSVWRVESQKSWVLWDWSLRLIVYRRNNGSAKKLEWKTWQRKTREEKDMASDKWLNSHNQTGKSSPSKSFVPLVSRLLSVADLEGALKMREWKMQER